ncbi:BglII/BstYI family type II restriction endonuclease [Butyrivibrio sp. FCS014]|uniref:BglII/BstYI family type II restriction endonuclease n=1 Tax=Butyrivibrio sp. FCS014 TaxID=1408304 RepID=UPI000466FBFC|nr:BglII/BstYI family type II restriction endonuclease [Butyrivibrio sp. FCS014]
MSNKRNVKFVIAEESFINNGKIILNSMYPLEDNMRAALCGNAQVSFKTRRVKGKGAYQGIDAKSINTELRRLIKVIADINGETHVEDGIFYHKGMEGFDFSIYDKEYNLARIYNYYLGAKGILNGDSKIYEQNKKMGVGKREWKKTVDEIRCNVSDTNIEYVIEKKHLTVAGEFQFGNWALIYRDLFRLLNADDNPGIDFYIYVAATGKLKEMISDNTVNYAKALKVIEENKNIIKTPIWVIGLDFDYA